MRFEVATRCVGILGIGSNQIVSSDRVATDRVQPAVVVVVPSYRAVAVNISLATVDNVLLYVECVIRAGRIHKIVSGCAGLINCVVIVLKRYGARA